MPDIEHSIAALLGSRICHDLISPLGAIGNGVELLSMAGCDTGAAELALISESVESANARIRFFRIAFGSVGSGGPIADSEIHEILSAYEQGARVRINWQVTGEATRGLVKLGFLLIQCLETAMPFGGTVTIADDAHGWRAEGHAEKMKVNPELWEVLSNPAAGHVLKPAEVQFALVPQVLRDLDRSLKLEISEDVGIAARF